jgi:hypothetical protein
MSPAQTTERPVGGAIAVYLTRPAVKRAFQQEIEVINFKDL